MRGGIAEAVAAGVLPGRVWLYSNYHCNLACTYCLTGSAPGVPRRELGAARMLRLADEARDLGFTALGVTGGEGPALAGQLGLEAAARLRPEPGPGALRLHQGRRRARGLCPLRLGRPGSRPAQQLFGWGVLLVEAALGAFLLLGLATRLWAVVGLVQSVFITLSVLNTPGEWEWSYYLMIAGHLGVFALAAGRVGGLDGLLRPLWARSGSRVARLLLRAS